MRYDICMCISANNCVYENIGKSEDYIRYGCSDPFPNLTHFRIVVCDDRSYHIIMCNNNVNNNNTVFIVTTPEQVNSFMSSKYANEKKTNNISNNLMLL